MIIHMKKLTLLCRREDRDEAVDILGRIGVVHVVPVTPGQSERVEALTAKLDRARRALEVLPEETEEVASKENAEHVIDEIWELLPERERLQDRKSYLESEYRRMTPYGDFDPAIVRRLWEKGVFVKLYKAGPKVTIRDLDIADEAYVHVISRDKESTRIVVAHTEDIRLDLIEEVLPEMGLDELGRAIIKVKQQLERNRYNLDEHAGDRDKVAEAVRQFSEELTFVLAKDGMGEDGPVAYLQGYFPERDEKRIERICADHGYGYIVSDPNMMVDEPPTLIENPPWVRPIQAVLDMIGVTPSYDSPDVSPVFLLFLTLFFAMLVGDAGYGIIFLALSVIMRFMKKLPARVTNLLTVMSLATIVWGILTGTYFGIAEIPGPLAELRLEWLTNVKADENLMQLCFLIGAVHLTLAHIWRLVRLLPSLEALAQVGWIMTTWVMYFAAKSMVLLQPFPNVMFTILGVGAVLIIVFMTPVRRLKSQWFEHVMLPLNLIGNFVDVVSYVRLFAVGAATFAVASSFNAMALGEGMSGPLAGLLAGLILFLGHGLNILLACMGVLVHGVRLNTLEFANHIGVNWSGVKFNPLKRRGEPSRGIDAENV
ncbi:V-type ATP synthase subunit I [Desulfovibrio inopinatus]|uniref:V-type ATP synthase subunit I n=1 Tax=Desulfovibrio inopinatus TaxID=102109 RepID=UPI00041C2C7B|nr:hypothetical protein [Desulfovibrio inopinatus]